METEELTPEVKLAIEAAARSLGRCEQCRASLEKKLLQKEFDSETIKTALDYLESKKYLDDERYASVWIRSHCMFKPQGKIRLLQELTGRGVKKPIAEKAILEYFYIKSEESLCEEAFKKIAAKKKDLQKIMNTLAAQGFSYSLIQKTVKNNKEGLNGSD